VFFFAMLYPFAWVGDRHRSTAAAAGGCMLIRRTALERIGGLEAIKGALIDDCALAGAVKRSAVRSGSILRKKPQACGLIRQLPISGI
jgi:GT2 family glycosyltransferase